MRARLLIPLALCFVLAGCASDEPARTGIDRATAIRIAEDHCPQYPDPFGYVNHAEWHPDGGFWVVALTGPYGHHGRAFKIGPEGRVLGSHVIDRGELYGPGHFGYGYDWN